jgi:hypothetical protein
MVSWKMAGFPRVLYLMGHKNPRKPQNTCGNRRNAIDIPRQNAECELRHLYQACINSGYFSDAGLRQQNASRS